MAIGINNNASYLPKTAPDRTSTINNDSALSKLASDFGNFIKLLTVQLQHQDPTEPLDANQFTQQLVQFTGVEQSINTNKYLEKLVDQNKTNQMNNVVGYIDKDVEINSNNIILEDGKAKFTYELGESASKVNISILNTKGRMVHFAEGKTFAGKHEFTWNGKGFEGSENEDGMYKVVINATDAKGQSIDKVSTYTIGRVTGAMLNNNDLALNIGNKFDIPMNEVISIRSRNQ